MPRFSLRTLMVVMLVGGPVLAGAWWEWRAYCVWQTTPPQVPRVIITETDEPLRLLKD